MGCCLATCQSNFHFMCARVQNCVFQQDRKVYCYKHGDLVSNKVGKPFPINQSVCYTVFKICPSFVLSQYLKVLINPYSSRK